MCFWVVGFVLAFEYQDWTTLVFVVVVVAKRPKQQLLHTIEATSLLQSVSG